MLAAPPPMDFSVDMSCDIKVNNSCELCHRKVNEVMQSLTAFYSVTYLGENNTIKLKARANPNVIMGISHKYGDHGKITNFHMNGQPFLPGNYGYPLPNPPPPQKESTPPQGIYKQHTAPPSYVMQPPPPMPLSSYSYIEPPYWPMSGR
ncbi:hypothetical protein DY000_02050762 [Brassica cretica]|uniref:HMA domain-containing protein n=1 Tax=Brassica cretica TaxID=69181 RepID=A0ABQ7F5D0_BRACR|nr:hypothetical protein DY000_02050762 [Brassica cretica]